MRTLRRIAPFRDANLLVEHRRSAPDIVPLTNPAPSIIDLVAPRLRPAALSLMVVPSLMAATVILGRDHREQHRPDFSIDGLDQWDSPTIAGFVAERAFVRRPP